MTTKLEQLRDLKERAEREVLTLRAKVAALDAAIAELDQDSPALEPMQAERDAFDARATYITDRADALTKAHAKEPKP